MRNYPQVICTPYLRTCTYMCICVLVCNIHECNHITVVQMHQHWPERSSIGPCQWKCRKPWPVRERSLAARGTTLQVICTHKSPTYYGRDHKKSNNQPSENRSQSDCKPLPNRLLARFLQCFFKPLANRLQTACKQFANSLQTVYTRRASATRVCGCYQASGGTGIA